MLNNEAIFKEYYYYYRLNIYSVHLQNKESHCVTYFIRVQYIT